MATATTPATPPSCRRSRRCVYRDIPSRYLSTPAAPAKSSSPTTASGDTSLPFSPEFPRPPPLSTKYHPYLPKPPRRPPAAATPATPPTVRRPRYPSTPAATAQPKPPRAPPSSSFADENEPSGVEVTAIRPEKRCILKLFDEQNGYKLFDRKPMPGTPVLSSQKPFRMPGSPSAKRNAATASKSDTPSLTFHNAKVRVVSELPVNLSKLSSRPPSSKGFTGVANSSVLGTEQKKGKKMKASHEDGHILRVLDNQLLQWRFANAKAQGADRARTRAAEKSLYGASSQISELRDSVALKRMELEKLKREENLFTIMGAQVPHLHQWEVLEGDYSNCLSEATNALQDASVRVPVNGNVKADIGELKEALESATNLLEAISLNTEKFLPQAEALDDVTADLARVINTEKALVEECGDLLSLAQDLQVKEWSLRTQLMQLKHKGERERKERG